MADKVTRLRPVGKRALQIYIHNHFDVTGVTLAEWDAWEKIIEACNPALWKEAIEFEARLENGKTPSPDEE